MNKLTNSYIKCMAFNTRLECLGNNIYVRQTKKKVPYMDILTTEIEKKLIFRKKLNGKLKQCVIGIFPTIKIEDALKKSNNNRPRMGTTRKQAQILHFFGFIQLNYDRKEV